MSQHRNRDGPHTIGTPSTNRPQTAPKPPPNRIQKRHNREKDKHHDQDICQHQWT
jgi:hypothetical protein